MNPPTTSRNTNPAAGHYVPGRPVGVVGGVGAGGGGGGGLYLNAYEVSFPYEESLDRTPAFHVNQSQHIMEEPMVMEPPPQYSTFMLISNLRTHLYVSLEKNAWLQKRIEELEEERNFLRCQMSCFISNMRGQEVDLQHAVAVKEQPASSPSPPSPMTTRSGMTLKRRALPRSRRSSTATVPVKQEYHMEEEKYYAEEEYMEEEETVDEEEEDSSVEKRQRKKGRGPREPKMRRVFRITHGRERQRVKDPDGVLMRYKKILTTYQRVRSMSRAFQAHGVDRNTMASTSPIAELMLVAPEKLVEVGEFEAPKEKLLDYARRCYKAMDEQTHLHVQAMKKTHKLLPISYRFRN